MANNWHRQLLTALIVVFAMPRTTAQTTMSTVLNGSDARPSNGPLILPSEKDVTLQKGQNYTLICKGNTGIQFKQQEIPEEITGNFVTKQRELFISEGEYKYEIVLELYNVNQFAIGYYACYDDSLNGVDMMNNLVEEPNDTAHIAFIYIYVNGTDSLFAPMREVTSPRIGSMIVIECRPTTPDVEVTLTSDIAAFSAQYSPKIGFVADSDAFPARGSMHLVYCEFQRRDGSNVTNEIIVRKQPSPPPQPKIFADSKFFLKGETFSLNCTVDYPGYLVTLKWEYPRNGLHNIVNESNEHHVLGSILYKSITIVNATEANDGIYKCEAENKWGRKTAQFNKTYLDQPLIKIEQVSNKDMTTQEKMSVKIVTNVSAYPPVKYNVLKDNKQILIDNAKYYLNRTAKGWPIFMITKLQVSDSGSYTLEAYNDYNTKGNFTYSLRVSAPPVVTFGSENKTYRTEKHNVRELYCYVTGFPLPKLEWLFTRESSNETEKIPSTNVEKTIYEVTSHLAMPAMVSGNVTCQATNMYDSKTVTRSITREFLIYEIEDGFGIKNKKEDWYSQNDDITITCVASKYDFVNVSWWGPDGEEMVDTVISRNELSLVATLTMYRVTENDSGRYTCRGVDIKGDEKYAMIEIRVAAILPPEILMPTADMSEEVYRFQSIQLPCHAEAVPPPAVDWYKDGELLKNNTQNVTLYTKEVNHTRIYTTLMIENVHEENLGTYECLVTSGGSQKKRTYTLTLKVEASHVMIISVIIPIILLLILLVAYLIWRIKKEKEFKRELAAAGLLYFKKGVTKSLNPDLGIDEQAELLPYDEKFEFPPEKLKLGHQLGAGAFGVVYKAEARGIVNAEETTVVAVKMVKKTADNMYIKALASELKIMVHLGKHINIVNLLGACTKNVGKRELIVIVEYCKFGNIHNYMQRHREVFIDQLTDNKEKNFGKVNRGFSCSGGSTGAQSDYFSTNNTQDTDHTFLNSANTNRSARKEPAKVLEFVRVSEGYVQPEWRTNYESDYSFDGRNPRPLSSRDLLAWAFQIARGMEYLASRKVLHGDLAARNILLAEDNVVKICDFGLARSIYNNDEYQKKENSLLPLKWLAIECMTDRIFSTQSDVWSFGIVLWELFSLAKTPYPNISPQSLLQWLTDGNRLAKPSYADDKVYNVMLRCWEQKPTSRPSFSQLQEILGGFLEDNVRNHYVDLNSMYTDMNVKAEGQEDYLAMVCAPDYNNLVTPSPHHYANESSFFPHTPSQVDEEGYLQMSPVAKQNIFNPRVQDTKFDFDSRKFNERPSEVSSYGSELTPMLTLNNLPRSGSESDHEGNGSPYPNKCTSIKEEDEVFETSQNNVKNAQNIAVTNPTYITFDVDIEKKPKDIINNYINVPNGLVK